MNFKNFIIQTSNFKLQSLAGKQFPASLVELLELPRRKVDSADRQLKLPVVTKDHSHVVVCLVCKTASGAHLYLHALHCLYRLQIVRDVVDALAQEVLDCLESAYLDPGHWLAEVEHLHHPVRAVSFSDHGAYHVVVYAFRTDRVVYVFVELNMRDAKFVSLLVCFSDVSYRAFTFLGY